MPSRRLVESYTQRLARLRTRTAAIVLARYTAADDLDGFVTSAVTPTLAGQRAAALLTIAYAQRSTGQLVDVDPDRHIGARLRGVSIEAQYGRAVNGASDAAEALRMVETTAYTGVQTAMRSASQEAFSQTNIVGYRRVLTGLSCGRCAAASTKRYHKADLLPIHAHCDCSIAPIVGDSDPGAVINSELLGRLKGETPDYWNARHFKVTEDGQIVPPPVRVVQDAELGPVLEIAGRSQLTTVRLT